MVTGIKHNNVLGMKSMLQFGFTVMMEQQVVNFVSWETLTGTHCISSVKIKQKTKNFQQNLEVVQNIIFGVVQK